MSSPRKRACPAGAPSGAAGGGAPAADACSPRLLACVGCGAGVEAAVYPFRCPRAADLAAVDHVLGRKLNPESLAIEAHGHPFLRYRRFLYAWHFARRRGFEDAGFVELVLELDAAVARVDGRGFSITPLRRSAALESHLGIERGGAVWVKDETGGVAGSHKARHLMGIMLYLEVVRALGLDDPRQRGLAIASCGNAALAAAVVARAAGYPLRVFVPDSAAAGTLVRIASLGATIEVCPRQPGTSGDPSYGRFRQAVAEGALAFCCQGTDNGLTIDGGATLWLEALEALAARPPAHIFAQIGGGALASSGWQAISDLRTAGILRSQPRVHAVQTRGAHPLKRAWELALARAAATGTVETMHHARAHRAAYMWPWETTPHSIAHGILDDETYDWAAVTEAMLETGGSTVVVEEDELLEAVRLARDTTAVDVSATGTAGLAGLMQRVEAQPELRREQSLVVFTGRHRA